MKVKMFVLIALVVALSAILFLPKNFSAQGPANCPPDKELCAKMLRFGQQAYLRGKYLDAKEYFRKAIQADASSVTAWSYYDMSVVFALAEKVEKNASLILPDVSTRQEAGAGLAPEAAVPSSEAPVPTSEAAPQKSKKGGIKFKIVDDEGC
ncbi:MAG: hypothetical protein KKH68_11230 [Proteobacteria bacterium]|nr:hypothetical protein [Pseudomonadota bacterium]